MFVCARNKHKMRWSTHHIAHQEHMHAPRLVRRRRRFSLKDVRGKKHRRKINKYTFPAWCLLHNIHTSWILYSNLDKYHVKRSTHKKNVYKKRRRDLLWRLNHMGTPKHFCALFCWILMLIHIQFIVFLTAMPMRSSCFGFGFPITTCSNWYVCSLYISEIDFCAHNNTWYNIIFLSDALQHELSNNPSEMVIFWSFVFSGLFVIVLLLLFYFNFVDYFVVFLILCMLLMICLFELCVNVTEEGFEFSLDLSCFLQTKSLLFNV